MAIYINSEMMDVSDQNVDTQHAGVIGSYGDAPLIDDISKNIDIEWQHKAKRMTGRERYLALCQKLGLKPKEPRR